MKITNYTTPLNTGVKRFYVPFEVTSDCPECGQTVEGCGNEHYLSYPAVNAPEPVSFYCEHLGEGYEYLEGFEETDECEWTEAIIIRITAEKA